MASCAALPITLPIVSRYTKRSPSPHNKGGAASRAHSHACRFSSTRHLSGVSLAHAASRQMGQPRTNLFAHTLTVCAAAGDEEHWMDFLKFDGNPTFDVIEKTKEINAMDEEQRSQYIADDYVFRGSIIGPISAKEVKDTQAGFNISAVYPDLDRNCFGYAIDPENPYRCLFFERWTATSSDDIKLRGLAFPNPNKGRKAKLPTHAVSMTWNPEGKVVYVTLSPPVDRFEGNTKGQSAVFGLLSFAGLDVASSVGDPALIFQQKTNMALGGFLGKAWSFEADIPKWWKSKARGAEPNDV